MKNFNIVNHFWVFMRMNWLRNLIESPEKLEDKFGTLYFILINLISFVGKNDIKWIYQKSDSIEGFIDKSTLF